MLQRWCFLVALMSAHGLAGEWRTLPPLPDAEGFAGTFAGVSGEALLVAGGANFPGRKPWEGGTKQWSDTVFVLERPDGNWQVAGRLPRPLGYGVSVTHQGGIVCAGGSDSRQHHAQVFRLDWKNGQVMSTPLPSLPHPLANACGALVGDTLYVAGGQRQADSTSASRAVMRIDLAATNPEWETVPPCPGCGRILATAASFQGAFWWIGGAELIAGAKGTVERRYLNDAYRFSPQTGWKQIADLPHPAVAAPSPAPTTASGFFVLGGDDGSQTGVAPEQHSGFSSRGLHYDVHRDVWADAVTIPAARVTVPCVQWGQSWIVPSGEARPGVRSPAVWSFSPTEAPRAKE